MSKSRGNVIYADDLVKDFGHAVHTFHLIYNVVGHLTQEFVGQMRPVDPPLSLITTVNKPPGSADIHASHVYHLRRQYRIYAIQRGSLA